MSLAERLFAWLSPSDAVCPADLVFALAGRQSRKIFALQLFEQRVASTILLSVARFEIRKFAQLPWPGKVDMVAVAAPTPAPQRHYFVSFDWANTRVELISCGSLGTLTEIRALADWLADRPHLRSVLIVSSAPHLRRVRSTCRALLPAHLELHFVTAPDDGPLTPRAWQHDRSTRWIVLLEIPKLLLYKLLLAGAHRHAIARART